MESLISETEEQPNKIKKTINIKSQNSELDLSKRSHSDQICMSPKSLTKKTSSPGIDTPILQDPVEEFYEEISESPDRVEVWKKFLSEKFALEQYCYYEEYMKYKNEKDEEKKKLQGELLFSDFVSSNGKTSIGVSQTMVRRCKKYLESGSEKGFQLILQQSLLTIGDHFNEYKSTDYEKKNIHSVSSKKQEKKILFSKNFQQLITIEKEYKFFISFVEENYGKILIECYNSILENDPSKHSKIFKQFVDKNSSTPFTFNTELIDSITQKYNLKDKKWIDEMKESIEKILIFEYYPRFVNSDLWKNYISSYSTKNENTKFEEKYEILKVDKDLSSFSLKMEILSLKDQLTNSQFKAKKIGTSSNNAKEATISYLNKPRNDNLIHLNELLKEENPIYQETTLYIITNDVSVTLDKFLDDLKESEDVLSQIDLYDFMFQITSGVHSLHEKEISIDVGFLNEFNIYFSETFDKVFVDPGFYYDDTIEIPICYLKDHYGMDKKSSFQEDVFSLGILFFRLITNFSQIEIEDVYTIPERISSSPQPQAKKQRSFTIKSLSNLMSPKKTKSSAILSYKQNKRISNQYLMKFSDEMKNFEALYPKEFIELTLSMLDVPHKRPTTGEILKKLQEMKKLTDDSKSRSNENGTSLVKIQEGWNKKQKEIMGNDIYRQYLKEFLRTEFSVEGILFYEDVMKFKELKSSEKFKKAQQIISCYLSAKSKLQVNVNSKKIKHVSNELKNQIENQQEIKDSLFDDALGHI
eukprot:gene1462-12081_t